MMDEVKHLLEEDEEIFWQGNPVKPALNRGYFVTPWEIFKSISPMILILPSMILIYVFSVIVTGSYLHVLGLLLLIFGILGFFLALIANIHYYYNNKLHDTSYFISTERIFWYSKNISKDISKFSYNCRANNLWEKLLTIEKNVAHVSHEKVKEITVLNEKASYDVQFKLSKNCSLQFIQVEDVFGLMKVLAEHLNLKKEIIDDTKMIFKIE